MAQCKADIANEADATVKSHIMNMITTITSGDVSDGLYKYWGTVRMSRP